MGFTDSNTSYSRKVTKKRRDAYTDMSLTVEDCKQPGK